jgi:hypothetical protein
MGRETTCQCDWAGVTANVKALLETNELILRGELRRKIPFADLKNVEAHADRLTFKVGRESVQLFLGQDSSGKPQAEKWAAAIKAGPVPLAKKLGITADSTVHTIGDIDDESINEALANAAQLSSKNPSLIVARVDTPADLDAAFTQSKSQLAAGTPIWLIYPKGPGHPLNESMIRAAVLPRGLVDTKVAAVSAKLTAIRFNLRRSKPAPAK